MVQQRFVGEQIWEEQAVCASDVQCYDTCALAAWPCELWASSSLFAGNLGPLCLSRVTSSSNTAAQVALPEGCQGTQRQLDYMGRVVSPLTTAIWGNSACCPSGGSTSNLS